MQRQLTITTIPGSTLTLMIFDKVAYRNSKNRVIQLIKASHDWEKTEGFIADGVIAPDVYALQPLRVLCILAESYGYDECGMVDIENQPQNDLMGVANHEVKTPRRLATMLHLLLTSAERGGVRVQEDEWAQMPSLLDTAHVSVATHQNTLSKIAWINVKKASNANGTRLNPEEARTHARRNQAVLEEQIAGVAPHLMLVCGRAAFASLFHMGLLGPAACEGRPWQLQAMPAGARFMQVSHPAYFRDWASYEAIYRSYSRIHEQWWASPRPQDIAL